MESKIEEDVIRFHGHLCPMFALGLRMGEFALEALGEEGEKREKESGVKLHAVVEYRNCFSDGLQHTCGTTYGKVNLHYRELGKFAATFYDLASGKEIRIKIKKNIVKKALEYGRQGAKVKAMPANKREEASKELFKFGRKMVEEFSKMGSTELFELSSVDEEFKPEKEVSLDYEICSKCGELFLKEFSKSKIICRACEKRKKHARKNER